MYDELYLARAALELESMTNYIENGLFWNMYVELPLARAVLEPQCVMNSV